MVESSGVVGWTQMQTREQEAEMRLLMMIIQWGGSIEWDELIEFSESMSEWADDCVGGRNEILFGLISTFSGNN